MLVHIIISCDYNPLLDPGLWVASFHSLLNKERMKFNESYKMTHKKKEQCVVIVVYFIHVLLPIYTDPFSLFSVRLF